MENAKVPSSISQATTEVGSLHRTKTATAAGTSRAATASRRRAGGIQVMVSIPNTPTATAAKVAAATPTAADLAVSTGAMILRPQDGSNTGQY